MNHDEIQEHVKEFQDGQGTREERLEIAAHFGACMECKTILKSWNRMTDVLFRRASVPSYFSQNVMVDIRQSPVHYGASPQRAPVELRPPWIIQWLVPAIAAAFAGFVLTMSHPIQDARTTIDGMLLSHADKQVPTQLLESTNVSTNQMLSYMVEHS
jgi:anti-sigma factor RsiW